MAAYFKKRKTLFISLFLLTIYYAFTYVSENEKYRLLNEVIGDNELFFPKVYVTTEKIIFFENNTTDFSIYNQLSIYTQKATQYFYSIKPEKIEYYKLDSDKVLKSKVILKGDNKNEMIYRISFPIVSSDKETMLIQITEDCNCMLGGQGGLYVFKKMDGKWKRVNRLNYWIS